MDRCKYETSQGHIIVIPNSVLGDEIRLLEGKLKQENYYTNELIYNTETDSQVLKINLCLPKGKVEEGDK